MLNGIIIRPGERAKRVSIEPGLDALQEIIGGYVENLGLVVRDGRRIDVYMNEDGRRLGLPANRQTPTGYLLRGVLLILATETKTGETVSMTEGEIRAMLSEVAGWRMMERGW